MRGAARALAVASIFALGCAPAELGTSTSAIVGGMPTTSDPSVVVVIGQVPGAKYATLCTGSVVSPHVVLTAAHCVDPDIVGATAKFNALLGPTISHPAASDFLTVASTSYHPDFDKNNVGKGGDLGVVIMQDPLSLVPLPMNRTPLSGSMIGQAARLVGYGQTSGSDTTGATAGVRREVATVMGTYTDDLVGFGNSGAGTCEGDSGGPAFMTVGGEEVIVGLVSFGDQQCLAIGEDTRVDVYAEDWVDPFIIANDPSMVLPPRTHGQGCELAAGTAGNASFWVALFLLGSFFYRARARSSEV